MCEQASSNKAIVEQFWEALAARDWERFKSFFTPDAHYTDIGGPGAGATGPENIVKRLFALTILEGYEHLPGTNMIAEGNLVMTEHTERWVFDANTIVDHGFVSVTELKDGKICRWHDYSNLANIMDNAPKWWIDKLMSEMPSFS